jgi:general secretion pathway protein N
MFFSLAPQVSAADDAPSAPNAATIANPVARRPLADFPATLERPLFSPNRRKAAVEPPPPPPVQEPLKPPPAPPSVALLGVIADPEGSQALLRAESAKPIRVRVGDDVMGWRVTDIAAQQLTLTLGERAVSIALFAQKSSPALPPRGHDSSERRTPVARHDE